MTRAARLRSRESALLLRERIAGQQASSVSIQSASTRQAVKERVDTVEAGIPPDYADEIGELSAARTLLEQKTGELEARIEALEP